MAREFLLTADLIVVVPSRTRPQNVARVAQAWCDTDAFTQGAELMFAVDRDDPQFEEYAAEVQAAARRHWESITMHTSDAWRPMVPKLNTVASALAEGHYGDAIGFAGDDHLPRTKGWVARYVATLKAFGPGIVSCPDGYRKDGLPTQWAVSAEVVRALGRMVPAGVEHLYCDDAMKALGEAADAYFYLDDLLIEHLHPVAGHPGDAQHERVNSRPQYRTDRRAYRTWQRERLAADAQIVRELRQGEK